MWQFVDRCSPYFGRPLLIFCLLFWVRTLVTLGCYFILFWHDPSKIDPLCTFRQHMSIIVVITYIWPHNREFSFWLSIFFIYFLREAWFVQGKYIFVKAIFMSLIFKLWYNETSLIETQSHKSKNAPSENILSQYICHKRLPIAT